MSNYDKLILISHMPLPKEIWKKIEKEVKLDLVYEKSNEKKKLLNKYFKKIKREDDFTYQRVSQTIENDIFEYNIPINHWILTDTEDMTKLARQMIHCRNCGDYLSVSTVGQYDRLSRYLMCWCQDPLITNSFLDSKYYIKYIRHR